LEKSAIGVLAAILAIGGLLIAGPLIADPPPNDMKFSIQIVSDLADEIKTFKASPYEERRWGKKPDEVEKDYLGTPFNVIWDAVRQDSMRAPYAAYIEFTSEFHYYVEPSAKSRYDQLIGFTPIMHLGAWYFRYEYDVSPTTVKFTRAFVKYPGGGGAGKPFPIGAEPFPRYDMCWDGWLRQNGEYKPK